MLSSFKREDQMPAIVTNGRKDDKAPKKDHETFTRLNQYRVTIEGCKCIKNSLIDRSLGFPTAAKAVRMGHTLLSFLLRIAKRSMQDYLIYLFVDKLHL